MKPSQFEITNSLDRVPKVSSDLAVKHEPVIAEFSIPMCNPRHFVVPKIFIRHDLIAKQYFYSIPERLLDLVVQSLGVERFDPQLLEMERTLSALVGDHTLNVGIRRGAPISYELLMPHRPLEIPFDHVKNLGWGKTSAGVAHLARIGDQRLRTLGEPVRGYCGWLMTNPKFITEHDNLLRRHRDRIRKHDLPIPILGAFGGKPRKSKVDKSWVAPFRDFCRRWRLQSLVGPGLPRPLSPQLPSLPEVTSNLEEARGGTSVYLPDIFPIAARGTLLEAIGDAVHGQQSPKHLSEWHRIIGRQNPAKNAITRYGRVFTLQHYWRLFHARHPDAVRRNTNRLKRAFGEFLDVGEDSIARDLTLIVRRLGSGWERRPSPLA